MDWKTVQYETLGAIARISLSQPERHNTMSAGLIKDLDAAVRHADADPSVRVVIIRGEGASFSAGHDLSANPDDEGEKDHVKVDLLAALRASGEELVTTVRALPPATLEEGRYENGWTARQILAHVAAIEWTYPRLIENASLAGTPAGAGSAPVDIHAYNERQVAKRAAASVDELLAEFERNRATTIRAVESADGSLLAQPVRSAGGRQGSLAQVLMGVAVDHVRGHLRDIVGPRSART